MGSRFTGWCLIPPTILKDEELSASEKILIGRVHGLQSKIGWCFAGNEHLADSIDRSAGRVANMISDLVTGKEKLDRVVFHHPRSGGVTGRLLRIGSGIDRRAPATGWEEIERVVDVMNGDVDKLWITCHDGEGGFSRMCENPLHGSVKTPSQMCEQSTGGTSTGSTKDSAGDGRGGSRDDERPSSDALEEIRDQLDIRFNGGGD